MKNPYLRIFAPRVVIYLMMALVMAFVMHQYGKHGNRASQSQAAVPVKEHSPELKAALKGNPKPIIVVLSGENDDLSELVAKVQKEVGQSCHITHLASDSDEAMKKIFAVKKFPAAILYDISNQEIERCEGEVTLDILLKLARKP